MKFNFWKRNPTAAAGKKDKLPRPKELSDRVGIHLVTQMQEDPDWVWTLKSVSRPRESNRRQQDIRIFDPRDARDKQIEVQDFTSLDEHPDLILFSGLIDNDAGTVELAKTSKAAA